MGWWGTQKLHLQFQLWLQPSSVPEAVAGTKHRAKVMGGGGSVKEQVGGRDSGGRGQEEGRWGPTAPGAGVA